MIIFGTQFTRAFVFLICFSNYAEAARSLCLQAMLDDSSISLARENFLKVREFNWLPESATPVQPPGAPPILWRMGPPPPISGSQMTAFFVTRAERLPSGLVRKEQVFYNRVFHFLRHNGEVFDGLKIIEFEIKNKKVDQLTYLAEKENEYGFSTVALTTRVDDKEWIRYYSQGVIPSDIVYDTRPVPERQGPNYRNLTPGRWVHGPYVHRFQLRLLINDAEARPELYGLAGTFEVRQKLFYHYITQLGAPEFNERLDWGETGLEPKGEPNLVAVFFDSLENNGSSFGFYHEYRQNWPTLDFTFDAVPKEIRSTSRNEGPL